MRTASAVLPKPRRLSANGDTLIQCQHHGHTTMNLTLRLRLGFANLSKRGTLRPATLTREVLSTFNRPNLTVTHNAISSPVSADGPTLCRMAGWPDERPVWTGSCPCQPFSAAGRRGGTTLTTVTYGRNSIGSLASADLQQSLANRLQVKTASLGSTLFRLIWKERTTPSGRRICALRASAHRTLGNGWFSWPTACVSDSKGVAGAVTATATRTENRTRSTYAYRA